MFYLSLFSGLMGKENQLETTNCGVNDHNCPPVKNEELAVEARYSTNSDSGLPTCRVCHSAESGRRGDVALGITPPIPEARKSNADETTDDVTKATEAELKNFCRQKQWSGIWLHRNNKS